jgi:DNA topoisomerase-2
MRVMFKPDFRHFGMTSIDPDTVSLLKKRVYEVASTVKDIKVYLNDELKGFKQYIKLYLTSAGEAAAENSGSVAQAKQTIIYEHIGECWEFAFVVSDGNFQHVSFANLTSTFKGSSHVSYVADQIAKSLISAITKKNKAAAIEPSKIKEHMWIFVNAPIDNLMFDSLTMETMTFLALDQRSYADRRCFCALYSDGSRHHQRRHLTLPPPT